jgi:hypothetical protein
MQDRKYFGMTIQQLGILIGLAIFLCLLFGLTGFFIVRRGLSGLQSQAPAIPPTAQMTATPLVLPTLTPTATLTPVPYEQLIPTGWKQYKTELVEIWLPLGFQNAKKEANEEVSLVSADTKKSLYKTLASVAYEPLDGKTMDAYIDTKLAQADTTVRVVERRKVALNSTEAVRMIIEAHSNGIDANELVYLVQDGGTVWIITYLAQINEFYDALPTFEKSAKTFRIIR